MRKIERQYNEVAGANPEALKINETAIEAYLNNFQWDFSKYRFQGRALTEIVTLIKSLASKVDEELKKLSQGLVEKHQNLSSLQRKKAGNVTTSDLEDILTPQDVSKFDVFNSDSLITLICLVPIANEKGVFCFWCFVVIYRIRKYLCYIGW